MFFAPQSGGVKRYLLAKRDWLSRHTELTHTLLVPGKRTALEAGGISTVASPPLPASGGYRFPLRAAPWRRALVALAPDLIEAGDPYRVPWAALAAAEQRGVATVAFYHSDLPRMLSARVGGWSAPYIRKYLRRLYARFDLVLAPSRVMLSKLAEIGVEHTALQRLGVDTRVFNPGRRDPELRARLGLAPETRLAVFAGRFSQEKHIDQLVAAFRQLGAGYHLLLVGGRRAARLAPNISLYPYQGEGEILARLIASSDFMVHAGDSETFGLVAAEAMACGLPVLGIDAGAIPELVDSEVGLLVQRPNAAELAAGIQALCEQDLAALGAAARARVERCYSWDPVLRSLTATYAGLTNNAALAAAGEDLQPSA